MEVLWQGIEGNTWFCHGDFKAEEGSVGGGRMNVVVSQPHGDKKELGKERGKMWKKG